MDGRWCEKDQITDSRHVGAVFFSASFTTGSYYTSAAENKKPRSIVLYNTVHCLLVIKFFDSFVKYDKLC